MSVKDVLLFVENKESDRLRWRSILTVAGYTVILASTPEQARTLLKEKAIDLAIIDLRLKEEDDPNDISGIILANEESIRHIPKIILTGHTITYENLREATGFTRDELPSVMTFVGKEEDPDALLRAIEDSIISWHQLRQSTIKASDQIQHDYSVARQQAALHARIALTAALFGFVIIIISIGLAVADKVPVAVTSMISGILFEALVLLFYSRLDYANQRVDLYHRELLQIYGLEILLSASERLPGETEMTAKSAVINSAADNWFTTNHITNRED